MLTSWTFDAKAAWKGIRGGGWASLVAVTALALGIGGSVTAAAVAYAGLLRPLPLEQPDDVVRIRKIFLTTTLETGIKLAEFDRWRERLDRTASVVASATESVVVRNAGEPRQIEASYVAGGFFEALGARPVAGRTFDGGSAGGEAVVSHRFATQAAGSAGAALSRTIEIGGASFQIVAVMPASFSVLGGTDVWIPARSVATLRLLGTDDSRYYSMLARLKPGHSLAELRANAQATLQELSSDPQRKNWEIRLTPLREMLVGDSRAAMLAFAVSSLLLLVIASANAAMLLVNRIIGRGREFAVRLALGAGRMRLVRTILLETAILAAIGAIAGGWLAAMATSAIDGLAGIGIPRLATADVTVPVGAATVLAMALVLAVGGAASAVALRHGTVATSLRSTQSTASRANRRLRGALVVAQLAIAIVLLTGAGLLCRTLLGLSRTDLGLNGSNQVVSLAIPFAQSTVAVDAAARRALVDRVVGEVRRIPGVEAAGVGSSLPPSQSRIAFTIRVVSEGRDATRKFDLVSGTDGYLDALGARLVQGRLFQPGDNEAGQAVAILSEFATAHLGLSGDVVDRELRMSLPSASGERVRPRIIGVIRDVRLTGLDVAASGGVYVLWRQIQTPDGFLVARTRRDPSEVLPALWRIVRAIDPSLPLKEPRTLAEVVDGDLVPRTARFSLVGAYAAAAVLLALVGLAGALVRSVAERQRELAIRAALGADPSSLLRLVLRQGLLLAGLGAAIGAGTSLLAGRALGGLIVGISAHDPLTFAIVLTGTALLALAACYVPARRAAATDPVALMRLE
jgi:predicted permease